jgi:hypothetical protein
VRSISTAVAQTGKPVSIGARLLDHTDRSVDVIAPGEPLRLRVTYTSRVDIPEFLLAFIVRRTTDQLLVYDGQITSAELGLPGLAAGRELVVNYDFLAHLTRGQYHIQCHVVDVRTQQFAGWLSPAGLLTIDERRTWGGVADLAVRASVASGALA